MTSVYIDEGVGRDDDAASGTESAPYKTLLHTMIKHAPSDASISYLTRKS
jgi:asparaginyl-tRNA synthetase